MPDLSNFSKPRKSKFSRKALALPGIRYKNNFMVGFEWPYTNSNGATHVTSMTESGWTCTCMGFTHHGKCKHITQVHERIICEDAA
jgi:hypothetical protein